MPKISYVQDTVFTLMNYLNPMNCMIRRVVSIFHLPANIGRFINLLWKLLIVGNTAPFFLSLHSCSIPWNCKSTYIHDYQNVWNQIKISTYSFAKFISFNQRQFFKCIFRHSRPIIVHKVTICNKFFYDFVDRFQRVT